MKRPICALTLLLLLISCSPKKELITMSVKGLSYSVEVARSDAEKQKGLMYRSKLDPKAAMLFVFDQDQIMHFWMKNTMIPLTAVFLSADGTVVDFKHMQPQSTSTVASEKIARYVLEVNLNDPDKYGYGIGDKFTFSDNFKR
jgi:uncharacterized membrane protein (UPF0127 family)